MRAFLFKGGGNTVDLLKIACVLSQPQSCSSATSLPHQPHNRVFPEKPEAQITGEIQAIIRQITASITFLPILTDSCALRYKGEWECGWLQHRRNGPALIVVRAAR